MRMSLWAVVLWGLVGCTDRQLTNPLDADADRSENTLQTLESLAGDGEVVLRWDYTHFADITGYRLYRRREGGDFAPYPSAAPLDAAMSEFVDREVDNQTTYEYQLALLVANEDERLVEPTERATPGPASGWVADRSTGVVRKISPDGRSAQFGQGRFPGLVDIAVHRSSGAVWVGDRFFAGLFRILPGGDLEEYSLEIGEVGSLSIGPGGDICWVIDREAGQVLWFDLAAGADSLSLAAVDAHFVEVTSLAGVGNYCWISDSQAGRVLRYNLPGNVDPGALGARVEFGGLERPGKVATGRLETAWVVVAGGAGLVQLAVGGSAVGVSLPFADVVDLAVDRRTGFCWVLGGSDLAAVDEEGRLLLHITEVPGGQSLAVDEIHQRIWVTTQNSLWKFTMEGATLARLQGFSAPFRVAVDPGAL
ncbi:MAG: hypothetical protein GKR89_27070 [Candidatus Latescibacteria bacterium]|nr:hypothetical protein [Candidatus Latescibacterota bacterium]